MKRGGKPSWVRGLAAERIEKLLRLAEENAKARPGRAKRYVELARRLSSRYKTRIPAAWKRRFCKKCGAFWVLGASVKVRANPRTKSIEHTCLECGFKKRCGYGGKRI